MPQGAYRLSDVKPIGAYSLSDVQHQQESAESPSSGTGGYFGVPDVVGDFVTGAVKGLGHTALNIGKAVGSIPNIFNPAAGNLRQSIDAMYGKPGLSDAAFAAADEAVAPSNTAQKIGTGVEQAAEFLVPAGAAERGAAAVATKLAPKFTNTPRLVQAAVNVVPRMATEAASAAGVAGAQGGDPVSAGVIGATAPMLSKAVESAAPRLQAAAAKQVQQFLGGTGQRYKAMAERITPEILKRGIRGSRESVMEAAAQSAETAGQAIDDALQQFGARKVNSGDVVTALESAKDAFRTTRELTPIEAVREGFAKVVNGQLTFAKGATINNGMVQVPIVIEPRSIRQLDGLQNLVKQLGPDPTVDQMVAIRRAWDGVVAQAGGYAHRAPGGIGLPLKDTTEAWAKREGANSLRRLLDQEVPELSALNKEYSFWKNLDDVLTQTTQRTAPQGPGLTREIAGVAGAAAGSAHGVGPAIVLHKLGKMANAVFTSPRWRLASAQMKDRLAWAIMQGRASEAAGILARISAGGASQAAAKSGGPP